MIKYICDKITIKEIIIKWLRTKLNQTITYNSFDDCRRYGLLMYAKTKTRQASYERIFRMIKDNTIYLSNYGIKLIRLNEYEWKVENLW